MNPIPIERHPLSPFLPTNAKVLMLGSFPPQQKRWSIHFFYPNFTNDMWRILGLLFYKDKNHFVDLKNKKFKEEEVIEFAKTKGIAFYDTAVAVRRLKDNASDKYLEIVEKTDIKKLLDKLPLCKAIVTTGEKATEALCKELGIENNPKMGTYEPFLYKNREIRLYRMPSSSRAYPIKVEKKAEAYKTVFEGLYNIKQD